MYSTKLRHLTADSPTELEKKIENIGFKVEIKSIIQQRNGGSYIAFFTVLDNLSFKSEESETPKKKVRKTNRRNTNGNIK